MANIDDLDGKEHTVPNDEPKEKQPKTFKVFDSKGNETTLTILDHEIKELYAQALIDGTSFVCVYFPSRKEKKVKVKDQEITTNVDWVNSAYIILSNGLQKKFLTVNDNYLIQNYKISVLETGTQRWNYRDFEDWLVRNKPLNPADTFKLLKETVIGYLDFEDDSTYNVYCLWIIGTYFHRLFYAYPYLDFTGTKRAGKTKALDIIKHTAFNTIMSPDFSGSSIFRLIEGTNGTLCLDEAEQMKNQKSESAQHVRTLIMQGFMRDQYAYRTNNDDGFKVERFNLFSPKALAHIKAFDDVLEDRCIQIVMKRSTDKKKLNRYPNVNNPVFRQIRSLCYEMFLDYATQIETLKQKAEENSPVHGREQLLWNPILTLAYFLEPLGVEGLIKSIIEYALISKEERQLTDEEENIDYRLAKFLQTQITQDEWRLTTEIYADLRTEDVKRKYPTPEHFSTISLSHTLKRLGLPKKHARTGTAWHITTKSVNHVMKRLGMIEDDKQTTLTLPSQLSNLSLLSQGEQETMPESDSVIEVTTVTEKDDPQINTKNTNENDSVTISDRLENNTTVTNYHKYQCTKCKGYIVNSTPEGIYHILSQHQNQHGQDHDFVEVAFEG